jgi:AraC-like DNA-binding protein
VTNPTTLLRTRGSTADVPVRDRMAYWEAICAATLVGLRCSSLSSRDLEVEKTSLALPDLGIADISGQDHLIERSPALVRQLPKESLFACQILRGSAYFIQRDRCLLAQTGDLVVYDTRVPYLFGFLTPMRQLLIDIPITTFDSRLDAELAALPLRIAPKPGVGAMLGATLRTSVERFMRYPVERDAAPFVEHTRTLVAELIDAEVNGGGASRASLSYLLTAKQYITTHLGDPELGAQAVADAVGLSLRHLSRLFAAEGESITQHIWSQRLSHAHRELIDTRLRKTSIGEIAFRWGFSSQAHFSRAIRERYGASPAALRSSC